MKTDAAPHADETRKRLGLLTRDEVRATLGVTVGALLKRMERAQFPRPRFGRGKNALWHETDVIRGGS